MGRSVLCKLLLLYVARETKGRLTGITETKAQFLSLSLSLPCSVQIDFTALSRRETVLPNYNYTVN